MPAIEAHDSVFGVNDRAPENASESEERPDEAMEAQESSEKDPEAQLTETRQALEEELARVKAESEDIKSKWLRSAADLENFKKRAVREREEAVKFGNERLLKDFLPVFDDLDRALEMLGGAEDDASRKLVEGMELVRKKFLSQLERHGVVSFESKGETFDPALHDAIQQTHDPNVESGRVLTEVQRGFKLNDRLLRPAMVVVSLGPAPGGEGEESIDG